MEQPVVSHSDIDIAINIAQTSLEKFPEHTSDYHRINFNLALYYLTSGNAEETEARYSHHLVACTTLPTLKEASNDLQDFLTIAPEHDFAKRILARCNERIRELSKT